MPASSRAAPKRRLARALDDSVAEVRQHRKGGGPTALQRASWRDPDDVSPTASRHARQVSGWMTYCPLRKMMHAGRGSQITEQHIHAADKLRQAADVAAIGFSAPRDGMPVNALVYGPKAGPSKAAEAQVAAYRDFKRATRLFTERQMAILSAVILGNWSIQHWCTEQTKRTGRNIAPGIEMGLLIGILESLAAYYRTDIDRDVSMGRVLPTS